MTVLTGLMKFLIIKWHWTELSIVRFCKVLKIFLPHEEEEKEGKREEEEGDREEEEGKKEEEEE